MSSGDKPDAVPAVRSADTCSWKYKRQYFVPFSFQVSLHFLEDQTA